MLAERSQLRIEIGIVPIGLQDCRLEIVGHQRFRRPTEMPKRILQTTNEIVGSLPIDGFTVRLARVAQHDSQDMRATATAVVTDNRRTGSKVDLGFFTRGHFDATKGQRQSSLAPRLEGDNQVGQLLGRQRPRELQHAATC